VAGGVTEGANWELGMSILDVQPEALTVLKKSFDDCNQDFVKLIDQMRSQVDALATSWKGPNHDRFVSYFDERYEVVALYRDFVSAHAAILDHIKSLYGNLEGDIDVEVQKALRATGL